MGKSARTEKAGRPRVRNDRGVEKMGTASSVHGQQKNNETSSERLGGLTTFNINVRVRGEVLDCCWRVKWGAATGRGKLRGEETTFW